MVVVRRKKNAGEPDHAVRPLTQVSAFEWSFSNIALAADDTVDVPNCFR
jgi:hypothetical protein